MNRFSKMLMGFLVGGVAVVLLQTLGACTDGRVALDQVVRVFGSDLAADPVDEQALQRFYDTYDVYSSNPENLRQREHFRDAFRRIRTNYVVETDGVKLVDAAVKGVVDLQAKPGSVKPRAVVEAGLDAMLASLDPHSSYLNPDELRESRVVIRGEFGGLGIEVTLEDGLVKVVSPIEDTPAFRAGIQTGDRISRIDNQPIKGKTLSEAVKLMRGRPGEAIVLTVLRDGVAPFDVRIVRAVIQVRSVRWRMEGDIAYVRITSFTQKVEPMLKKAFAGVKKRAGDKLKGVVLDLRNNPGGLLHQSLFVSDSFLDSGTIVSVRERDAGRNRVFSAKTGDLSNGVPMVVLINEGSASASEIVAGALRDQNRAVIMGRRSFGKGSVQTIQPLALEGGLRLTTARYYAPSGHTIQAQGVGPDIILQRRVRGGDKKSQKLIREADLPGALDGDAVAEKPARAAVDRNVCPKAGPKGDDLELGCALAYLRAGTLAAFLNIIPLEVTASPQL